ncbi:MAG: glutamine-synthetase adenylyltransferase [Desulfuromonadales bacterium GWD2_61_12]|nr:MAG: glutamine-synthetase adenylyltransferase [Desulfuromonadales bacterium GWD2_61_12]HBT83823.1 bifunctional [glutamate--ammonia ligase]-adenylyl-L-tyrosine phosphorylase/[glutamate--ammonia-ligase] adenylyltransferase [Desulfuromonas sp.]
MDPTLLARQLRPALTAADAPALQLLAGQLGLVDRRKAAANLLQLHRVGIPAEELSTILPTILATPDPDAALNHLERLTDSVALPALTPVLVDAVRSRQLLTILGSSPFLTGILCRDATFFATLFTAGEIAGSKGEGAMIAELRARISLDATFVELQKGLRRYKCAEILRIGSRDLCRLADLVEVTAELSALAAAALQRAYEVCDTLLRNEYGRPLLDAEAGKEPLEPEFTIFGMGKFGGRELNFSSDIDLIYFYTSEKGMTSGGPPQALGAPGKSLHLHQYFCKLADLISKALGEPTDDGFVFRVDLRLRPEGNSGELANSLRSAEVYYESWGQSWERAALLKARPVAGSIALGERLLKNLEPFIYRRFLDYAMIEDIKLMKQKIDRSLTREREGELNLKLGRGGIREIEFFIQAHQLIYAGKNPTLRQRNSLRALAALVAAGLVRENAAATLREAYIFLRSVEHRIQIERERQTHNLPVKGEELRALARRAGFAGSGDFEKALEIHRQGVAAIFHDLFYSPEEEMRSEVRPEVQFMFDPGNDPDLVKDMLAERGFKNADGAYESLLTLRDGPPNSHLTERAHRRLEQLAPLLLQEVIDSPEPEMALHNLERFLGALRARSTFYALLAENRQIIKVLVSLFGTSQFLSRIFIQQPEVLDSLVSRSYAVISKSREEMANDVTALLGRFDHYEDQLDQLRRFRKEEFLRLAMGDIHGNTPQGEGVRQLSTLADVCLEQALALARAELLPRYGLPWCGADGEEGHEAAFAIVGMGKLGGMELNYHSDLDIIFIYEGEGETRPAPGGDPDRFRGQTNQEYFARLAQRIISVLTLITREGSVYQIDTRLRPSGNQGPLVTSFTAYQRYHEGSAQPWERQALIKARVVVGPAEFAARIDGVNRGIVYERPIPENLRQEIYRLRGRMESEIAREGAEHFNIKTGRGGMVDVEFIAQYLQLLHGGARPELRLANTLKALQALHDAGILSAADFTDLNNGYKFLRRLENKLRLIHDQSVSELSGDRVYLEKLARRLGYPERPRRPDQVFLEDYRGVTEKIRAVFERLLGEEG